MNLVLMAKCFHRTLFDVNVVVLADISFETVVWSAFFLIESSNISLLVVALSDFLMT